MFFTNKRLFLFLLSFAQIAFGNAKDKKVSQLALEEDQEMTAMTTKKSSESVTNQKAKAAPLDYEQGQIIFGYNREYLFKNSKKASDERDEINDYLKSVEMEMMTKYKELETQRMSIEQKKKTAKPESLQKEEEDFGRKSYDLQRWQLEKQQELREMEESAMKNFNNSISEVTKEFCNTKGNERVVLVGCDSYVHSRFDASEVLASMMNKNYLAEKTKEKKEVKKDAATSKAKGK